MARITFTAPHPRAVGVHRGWAAGSVAALLVAGLCLLSGCGSRNGQASGPVTAAGSGPSQSADSSPAAGKDGSDGLTTAVMEVANKNIPAVVHIQITETQEVANPLYPFESSPEFRYFFGTPKNAPKKFEKQMVGIGSGILMDKEGHILTNNHVVAGANKIQVLLSDGRQFTGNVIGTDPKTDLAVIQISVPDPLPYLTFGDSDKVQVGQWVVAIGQPEGLNESVTQGIISAKHRAGLSEPSSYQDFLQTDAAINPGNSGGPLLTLDSEVIGVNSAILSQSGGFMGIGFAIPSNMAVYVAKQLIAHGKVERGWLGITVTDVTSQVAKSEGATAGHGAVVAGVVTGGPADKAGLTKGDVITEYRGEAVANASVLRNDVAMTSSGTKAPVTILRDSKKMTVTVTVGSMEEAHKLLVSDAQQRLGGEFTSLTAEEAKKIGLPHRLGVVVTSVSPKGALAEAGFEKGDLILEINGHPIANAQDFDAIVSTLPSGQKIMLVAVDHRTGREAEVPVVLQ